MEKDMFDANKMQEYFLTLKDGELYHLAIWSLERLLIEKTLERTWGNQITAAKILGLNRNTLRAKIKKLNINMDKFRI